MKYEQNMVLTETDHAILEAFKTYVEGLSDYLGEGYEIVLHSLENLDQSVIKIINGHYTGRKEGAPITDLALTMLANISQDERMPYATYFAKNKNGAPIKASTIAIRGEGGRIIGLMCMNFYLDMPLSSLIHSFSPDVKNDSVSETFAENVSEVIEKAVIQEKATVISDKDSSPSNVNKEIISRLNERGIFNLKDGVGQVAEILGLSKNTVYLHLRNQK